MSKITKIGDKGLAIIKEFEGWSAKPYLCPAGIPTIGYGNTFYANGTKVKMTDAVITTAKGEELLKMVLKSFEQYVDSYCIDTINQNQFDALCSFCYNLGPSNLKSSTLIKKVNQNPADTSIEAEFRKWNKSNGKALAGLTRRRQAEADLYFL